MTHARDVGFEDIKRIVADCIVRLFRNDLVLLVHDVSERAITHKLAEYLQDCLPDYNVDCEYNRDATRGQFHRKTLYLWRSRRDAEVKSIIDKANWEEDDLLAVSTYPDVVVHERTINSRNLLVIEVKKRNSQVGLAYDRRKLRAFTQQKGPNDYRFKYGVLCYSKLL